MLKKTNLFLSLCLGLTLAVGFSTAEAKEPLKLKVAEVKTQPTEHWSEERLRALAPELEKKEVDVGRLGQQIQMANDTKAVELKADFVRQENQEHQVTLTAEEKKKDTFTLSANNTGNEYTGDWRMGFTYQNHDFTGNADTLGLAFVTSPGHWEEVKQVGAVYKANLPRVGDSIYATYSWSDVDLGDIGNFGGIDVSATGKGENAGLHYQHNFKYSQAHKQILDVGVDYKHYDNTTVYDTAGAVINDGISYDLPMASVSYADIHRSNKEFAAWSVGYSANISSGGDLTRNRANSDKHFHLWKASVNYQRRLAHDWIVGMRGSAQYTTQNIVTTEQFGAGGISTVRGFKERAAYADKGYMASLEVYTPEIGKGSRFVVFTDYARVLNNEANPGEIDSGNIGSYGIGYRFSDKKSGIALSIDYAHAYTNMEKAKNNLRPWHVMLSVSF